MSERLSLASVNPSLTCTLCKGYFVNAMTLVRCMHSFCKSCINRHLNTSSACPTCQERVFRSRMDDFMIPDETLQNIVYKSVPGLYASEMRRRREFYQSHGKPSKSSGSGGCNTDRTEEKGYPERVIFTDDDMISLVLEHRQEEEEARHRSLKLSNVNIECAAATPITVLIRFIQNKFGPPDSLTVHFRLENISSSKSNQILLDPDFRLLDVCYIANYKAAEPLKLAYSFVQFDPSLRDPPKRLNSMAVDPAPRVAKSDSGVHRSISSNNCNGGNSIPYFSKPEVRKKGIEVSKGSLTNVEAILSPMKTYSRNSLAPLNIALSDNDSTEEECDNWDSNVSTTIDSVTNHHQKTVKPQAALQERNSANFKTSPPRTVQPLTSTPAKPTQSVPLSTIQAVQNRDLNVPRAQNYGRDRKEGSMSLPDGVAHVKRQNATAKLSTNLSRQRVISKTSNHVEKKSTSVQSQQQQRLSKALTVSSGKRPTVLKIKLNKSSTQSETFTITSPTSRDTRSSTLADRLASAGSINSVHCESNPPAGTASAAEDLVSLPTVKFDVLNVQNGPQTRSKSPSPTARDSRAAILDAKKRKRMEEDELKKIEEEKLKAKRAKKRDEREKKKPLINEVPAVFEQYEDLLDATSFGCRSSVLCWESQLRIPAPLTVPLTVTLAKRKTAGSETKQIEKMNSLQGREAFLRNNFGLEKNPNAQKGAALRWVKPQSPELEVKVKLPPPDFEMSDTLREVMTAMAEDNAKAQSSPPPLPPRDHAGSRSSVKFSISSILSGEVGHKRENSPKPTPFWNEVQSAVEMYISHMSRFFWLLESCPKASPVRSRILAACQSKTLELSRILDVLRKLSGSAIKNQIERVLKLSALIEKYVPTGQLPDQNGGYQIGVNDVSKPDRLDTKLNTEKKFYDVNRNQMPSNAVSLNVGTTPKNSLGESVAFPVAAAERHLHELIVKSTDAASKIPGMTVLEQTKLFDLISIKRSSSVSSLNTSDGSENFGDCEIDQHRWDDVELPSTMRPWPDCSTEA